jgi:hypothetical protein
VDRIDSVARRHRDGAVACAFGGRAGALFGVRHDTLTAINFPDDRRRARNS